MRMGRVPLPMVLEGISRKNDNTWCSGNTWSVPSCGIALLPKPTRGGEAPLHSSLDGYGAPL
jgi:hypothetical protein